MSSSTYREKDDRHSILLCAVADNAVRAMKNQIRTCRGVFNSQQSKKENTSIILLAGLQHFMARPNSDYLNIGIKGLFSNQLQRVTCLQPAAIFEDK